MISRATPDQLPLELCSTSYFTANGFSAVGADHCMEQSLRPARPHSARSLRRCSTTSAAVCRTKAVQISQVCHGRCGRRVFGRNVGMVTTNRCGQYPFHPKAAIAALAMGNLIFQRKVLTCKQLPGFFGIHYISRPRLH